MANDKRRSLRVKDDEKNNSKKKTVKLDSSPASSSRRSSRETSSTKLAKESPAKENLSSVRKSVRLEKKKPSGTTPAKEKAKKTREQLYATPMRRDGRPKKVVEEPVSSNLKSKTGKVVKSLKQCLMDTTEDKGHENQGLDSGGRKRKRATKSIVISPSKPQQIRTEAGDVDDEESQEKSSQANSSSSRDVNTQLEKTDELCQLNDSKNDYSGSKFVEDTEDSSDECGNRTGEESTPNSSKRHCRTLYIKEPLNDTTSNTDLSDTFSFKDRTTSEVADVAEIVEKYNDVKNIKSSEEWTVPCKLLKKRLVLFLKPLDKCQKNTGKVLDCHFEWLVQWLGLDDEQATWEPENSSVLDSPEGQNLIQEYEKHDGNTVISASSDDKIEEVRVKLPTIPAGCPPGMENIHLSYVKNLHDAWNKGQNSIVFDDQDRIIRIVLFIFSLKDVTLPFLLITTSDSVSQWEAVFLKIAPCNAFKVSLEATDEKRSSRLLQVQKEGGQLTFQVLLYPVDVFVKDINVLKSIEWEAVVVDESQSSDISSNFSYIKSLSSYKRLLVFCGPLGMSMTSYLDVLSLLDCDVISKTELDDVSKLKETLLNVIAYECKCSSSRFVEFWVPVQISNVQLEQYCSMLLSNAMALSSCSNSDTVGALHDILVTNRKCCDHPYIVDPSLQDFLTKDLGLSKILDVSIKASKILDVGIKASGKLQFLDLILPEIRKRQLRVLILFQPLSGSRKDSASIGDILDDFIRQRFGPDSYERVDGIGSIPSKKQAALNNFNNKDMGRFIFLLEYRACLGSIKLSSIDTIIIFGSDWNPANDLRALQKIGIDSQSEQIMVFRLYTSSTLEEKILRLAELNVTTDSKRPIISRSSSDTDALLMWGATYLFNKLDEFHSASVVDISSNEGWLNDLMEEFFHLISSKSNKDASKLIITGVQPICGAYGKNLPLPSQPDGELPHAFWRKLLVGRDPCWKYISRSTSRQRKRIQYFAQSPKKLGASNDDVGRKRKKTAINVIESVAPKPVIEEGNSGVLSLDGPKLPPGDGICNEMSFCDHLNLKISKLCEVLRLSEDVKTLVERFLKYVIENYRVNQEPASTLEAFLISLCWIGSALLKHKLDRSQSVALANEHLNFSCKEEEANSVYLKLEPAKEMFLSHTDNQKKTNSSRECTRAAQVTYTESLYPRVKLEIPESPHNQDDDATIHMEHRRSENSEQTSTECISQKEILDDSNQKDAECGIINLDTSDALKDQDGTHNSNSSNSPCAAVLKEKVPSVQPLVSPASGQPVAMNLEIREESIQDDVVQGNPSVLPEISNLQTIEEHLHVSAGTQQPDLHSADRVDSQPSFEPHNPSQNPEASSQVLETSAQVPNRAATPPGSNMSNGQGSGNHNQGASRRTYSNPLQAELEKLRELKDAVVKCHEAIKVKLKSEYDKELAEVIAQMNHKYEAKHQDAEAAFQLKTKEVDICFNRVIMNKVLADIYRSKCQDMTPFKPAEIQMIQSGGMQHLSKSHVQPSLGHPTGVTSYSSAQSSGSQQDTALQRPLQIVHRSTQLFSSIPSRPPSNTNPSTMPTRPPSTTVPTSKPSRQPSTTTPTRTPSRLPSDINSSSTPTRPPSTAIPTSTPSKPLSTTVPTSTLIRPPSTAIPTSTPSRPPSTTIPTSTPSRPPSTTIPISTPSIPPSNAIPTTTPSRPPSTAIPTTTPSRPSSTNVPTNIPSRPPPGINPITPYGRPTSNLIATTPSTRNLQANSDIRAPAPHIRPFSSSTSISHDFASHRVHLSSSLPMSQSSARMPLQTPPFPTNHHSHPIQISARSLPLTSSQPPSSVAVSPPASFQLPSLYSWQPPGSLSATSSSHFHTSLPSMPSVSISHTGLYNAPADILNQPALDLLMDMDRQAGFHQSDMFPSPTDLCKEGSGNDLVCLSDDD